MDTLLFNPNAGTAKKSGIGPEELTERLRAKGLEVELRYCATEQDMQDAAGNASGRVIVAGGDGTIHSLLQAVKRCNALRLGIIPLGSANHLAESLGIPRDVDAAVDTIVHGRSRRIDLGLVNETVFSQAAGVGFHAAIFRAYGDHVEKSAIDAASAALSTLADWTPSMARVIIDGEPFLEEVVQVTAALTPMYGGQFHIAPNAVMDDGLLEVVIFGKLNKVEIVEYAAAALRGMHVSLPKTHILKAKRVEVDAVGEDRLAVHADAMSVGYTPAVIEVLPGCLDVIAPVERHR